MIEAQSTNEGKLYGGENELRTVVVDFSKT